MRGVDIESGLQLPFLRKCHPQLGEDIVKIPFLSGFGERLSFNTALAIVFFV